jgi:hypothetical protein
VSANSTGQRSRNLTIARSHVMRLVRKQQREGRRVTKSSRQPSNRTVLPGEEDVASIGCEPDSGPSQRRHVQPTQDLYSAAFAAIMEHGFGSTSLPPTHGRMIEYDIRPLHEYTKKPVPNIHACIDHCEFSHAIGCCYPSRMKMACF